MPAWFGGTTSVPVKSRIIRDRTSTIPSRPDGTSFTRPKADVGDAGPDDLTRVRSP